MCWEDIRVPRRLFDYLREMSNRLIFCLQPYTIVPCPWVILNGSNFYCNKINKAYIIKLLSGKNDHR